MFRYLWHHWLYALALTCAGVLIGSLALMSSPAHAQVPSGQANTPLSQARQALQAELGVDSPYALRAAPGSPNRFHSRAADSQTGALKQGTTSSCWSVVTSPDPSADFDQLYGISAVSPKDIWAVGYDDNGAGGSLQTLIEHWNGSSWSVVASPDVGDGDNALKSVVAISPKDVWAVGYYWDGTRFATLTEHWDGSSWSVVSSPNPGGGNNVLNGVAAASRNDVWAVGAYRIVAGGLPLTLTEHWDGTSWSVVSSPNPNAINILYAVTALSGKNVWAVGNDCDANGCPPGRTLIEHWNGSSWRIVPSPNAAEGQRLVSVSATGPNDIWAVGPTCIQCGTPGEIDQPIVEHWDGTAWSIVSHAIAGSGVYWGVLAVNPNDAWAVGSATNDGGNTYTNLMSHWNGTSWSQVSVTSPGAFDNDLRSLAAIGPNDVWAVGDYDNGNGEQTQVQHFTGPCKQPLRAAP